MQQNKYLQLNNSFTLIELLIVIGILAILTAAVVIVLNPTELLKQGRDSTRMTDLASLSKTIQLLLTQNPSLSLGTASTVYISLPDTSSTCTNLSLPTLPAGYTYHCVPTASSTLLNSSGWLPIDFTSSIQSLPRLPIDPSQSVTSNLYYLYTPGISDFFLSSTLESKKYFSRAQGDGGTAPEKVEMGSNLSLGQPLTGLISYWTFDEGSGVTIRDSGSFGYHLGISGSGYIWQTDSFCKTGGCLYFPDTAFASVSPAPQLNHGVNNFTTTAWVKATRRGDLLGFDFFGNYAHSAQYGDMDVLNTDNSTFVGIYHMYYPSGPSINCGIDYAAYFNSWHMISFSKIGSTIRMYLDGSEVTNCGAANFNVVLENSRYYINSSWRSGFITIDDHRIYNRGLSSSEIQSIYNATR